VEKLAKTQKRRPKTSKKVKFTPPKIKVPKRDFDDVLGKLIQNEPQPDKRLK